MGPTGNFQLYNPSDVYFEISKDGVIKTKGNIDREAEPFNNDQNNYMLTILYDNKYIQLEIKIIDINDNSPRFESRFLTISMSENMNVGHEIDLPNAPDPDNGINSTQGYRIESGNDGNTFAITKVQLLSIISYRLKLVKRLDREDQEVYNLKIVAYDGGQPERTGALELKIIVEDENDCTPDFKDTIYRAEVDENLTPGSHILTVHAEDCDAGDNSKIVYSLQRVQNSINPFSINQDGKIFLQGVLDFEEAKEIVVQVKATDRGVNARSATTFVSVHLKDMNDNSPEIQILFKSSTDTVARVDEDAAKDSPVATVKVTDKDSGSNGDVACIMESSQGLEYFKLTKDNSAIDTWYVQVKKPPSRKEADKFVLSITCNDFGSPDQRVASRTFDVFVMDINDHYPIFNPTSYEVSMRENQPAGTEVVTVTATDDDDGDFGKITYKIESVEAGEGRDPGMGTVDLSEAFSIRMNGMITNNVMLDREKTPRITIVVMAIDGGTEPEGPHMTRANVIINVLDVNDNAPIFSNKATTEVYEANIKNDKPVGESVIQLKARDYDDGNNGAIRYNMSRDNDKTPEYFKINPTTGIITVASPLPKTDYTIIALTVFATDNNGEGLSGKCKVNIQIFGENKYSPKLSDKLYKVSVKESLPVPSIILRISAEDLDPSQYFKEVMYELEGGMIDKFSINSKTGELSVTRPLDYEQTQLHRFTVRAYNHDDGTNELKEDKATIEVHVVDVDDEPPRFSQREYNLTAHTEDNNGTVIKVIRAIDPDSVGGRVTYRLIEGNKHSYFKLKSTAEGANIIVNGNLAYMEGKTVSMILEAQDSSSDNINVDQAVIYIDIQPGKGVYAPVADKSLFDRFLPFFIGGGVLVLLVLVVVIVVICNRSKKQKKQFVPAKLPTYDHYDYLDFDDQVGLEADTIKTYNIDGGGECDRLSAFEALTSQLNALQYDFIDNKQKNYGGDDESDLHHLPHHHHHPDKRLLDSEGYFSLSDQAFMAGDAGGGGVAASPYHNENKDYMNTLANTQNHYSNTPVKSKDKYMPLSPPPPPHPGSHGDFVRSLPPITNQFLPLSPDLENEAEAGGPGGGGPLEPKTSVSSLLSTQSRPTDIVRLPTSLLDSNQVHDSAGTSNGTSPGLTTIRTSNLALNTDR